jgi:putative transposase
MSKKSPSQKPQQDTQQQPARKTYQFRIYPTSKQINALERWLGWCCDTYNAALDERKSAYRMAGISLSYAHQCAELPACKEVRPRLVAVGSRHFRQAYQQRLQEVFGGQNQAD